jgi:hypothetical protein
MLTFQRTIYDVAPALVEVPLELRQRRVEVIILALEEQSPNGNGGAMDALGWPAGFFEETAGQWAGEPLVREQPTEYETRLELS